MKAAENEPFKKNDIFLTKLIGAFCKKHRLYFWYKSAKMYMLEISGRAKFRPF